MNQGEGRCRPGHLAAEHHQHSIAGAAASRLLCSRRQAAARQKDAVFVSTDPKAAAAVLGCTVSGRTETQPMNHQDASLCSTAATAAATGRVYEAVRWCVGACVCACAHACVPPQL